MLVGLVKTTHLISIVCLMGGTLLSGILVSSRKFTLKQTTHFDRISALHIALILCAVFAMISGTFLVLPRGFHFSTPWIQAAYLFTSVYIIGLILLIACRRKRHVMQSGTKLPKRQQLIWRLSYLALYCILLAVIHDAVTKTTLLLS